MPKSKYLSDGTESPLLEDHQNSTQHEEKPKQLVKYGELVILGPTAYIHLPRPEHTAVLAAKHVVVNHARTANGQSYNGFLPTGDRGRRRSKFVLYKRATPNGVKRSRHYVVNTPHSSQAILDSRQHSISYTLSRNQAIIVEYMPDEETDMFQIGRSSETPIDFVVMDTVPGDKAGESKVMASTISRFACRILADRSNPRVARIYAAGFDSSRNIFLGEKATKWEEGREIDGLTTNGVLVMHPQGKFCGGDSEPGLWREVSVGGGIFSLRESRSAQVKGAAVEGVSNVLQDGTLIDLCGATLLWRSAEGLANSPTKEYLEKLVDQVNAGRPVCPVGLNTLVIPRKSTLDNEKQQPYVYLNCGHVQGHHDWGQEKDSNSRCCPMCLKVGVIEERQPYVYLNCGHVQGHHDWGREKDSTSRCCPMCLKVGPVQKLCMGIEPAFYVDSGPPDFFAFNPCGHMATEKTVKYWTNVAIPHGTNGFYAFCPFCATPLEGNPGYVRLIFN